MERGLKQKRIRNDDFNIQVIFLLLGAVISPSLLSSFLLIFNIPINFYTYPVSIILILIIYCLFFRKKRKLDLIGPLLISVIICAISFILSSLIWDITWDSWAYHIPSIIALADGWNPLYEHNHEHIIWTEHYLKCTWLYSAAMYKFTNDLFVGTSINTIITAATFFVAKDVLNFDKKIPKALVIIMSFIISLNPVIISQLLTTYNDGILGNLICMLILILYGISKKYYVYENNYKFVFIISCIVGILASFKFTGTLYAAIILIIYLIYLMFNNIIKLNKFTGIFFLLVLIPTLILVSNTYIPNYIHHQNLGYPLIGEGKVDIMIGNTPAAFEETEKIESFIMSLTAETYNYVDEYKPKSPFAIDSSEIYVMYMADVRTAGFGPFFQLILWISIIILIIALLRILYRSFDKKSNAAKKNSLEDNMDPDSLLAIVIFVVLIVITPDIWWARYIPYFGVFPLLTVILFKRKKYALSVTDILTYIMIIVYLISIPVYLYVNIENSTVMTAGIKSDLSSLSNVENDEPINIFILDGFEYREIVLGRLLESYGIDYAFSEYDKNQLGKEYPYLIIKEIYNKDDDNAKLISELYKKNNLNDYAEVLMQNSDDVIIVITAVDDASVYIDNFNQILPIEEIYDLKLKQSYIGVVDTSRDFIYEARLDESLSYNYLDQIKIESAGANSGRFGVVENYEKSFTKTARGLNIFVLDSETFNFIDYVIVDVYYDPELEIVR